MRLLLKRSRRVFSFALPALAFVCFLAQADTVTTSAWAPLYQGMDFATGSAGGTGVDLQQAQALRIDLEAPGISFYTTPQSGSLNTVSETTSQFLEHSGAQAAINGNFFSPCCDAYPENKTVIGLAVSDGSVVAPPTSQPGNSNAALLLSKSNQATITTTATTMDLSNVYNAVAGSAIIVANGQDNSAQSSNEGDPGDPNPRTLVGISQDGRYLYLVTIDGRQPGYSDGATASEAADMMIALGAYTALNLDGGGSTTMVRSDGQGGAIELNKPSGATERYDADALGVYALPLAIPEPPPTAMAGMGILALAFFAVLKRHTIED